MGIPKITGREKELLTATDNSNLDDNTDCLLDDNQRLMSTDCDSPAPPPAGRGGTSAG